MDVAQILGYKDSPNFLLADKDFPYAQELGHVFRKARAECGLQGVYSLRSQDDKALPIPVLYFCQAHTEAQARQIHRQVWNQGIVPFRPFRLLRELRLYSELSLQTTRLFRYRDRRSPSRCPCFS